MLGILQVQQQRMGHFWDRRVSEAVLILPHDGDRDQYDALEISLAERDIPFLVGPNSLGAALQRT